MLKRVKLALVSIGDRSPERKADKPLATSAPLRSAKLISPCRRKLRIETTATNMLVAEMKTALRMRRR